VTFRRSRPSSDACPLSRSPPQPNTAMMRPGACGRAARRQHVETIRRVRVVHEHVPAARALADMLHAALHGLQRRHAGEHRVRAPHQVASAKRSRRQTALIALETRRSAAARPYVLFASSRRSTIVCAFGRGRISTIFNACIGVARASQQSHHCPAAHYRCRAAHASRTDRRLRCVRVDHRRAGPLRT
jgi:hypothetical protein